MDPADLRTVDINIQSTATYVALLESANGRHILGPPSSAIPRMIPTFQQHIHPAFVQRSKSLRRSSTTSQASEKPWIFRPPTSTSLNPEAGSFRPQRVEQDLPATGQVATHALPADADSLESVGTLQSDKVHSNVDIIYDDYLNFSVESSTPTVEDVPSYIIFSHNSQTPPPALPGHVGRFSSLDVEIEHEGEGPDDMTILSTGSITPIEVKAKHSFSSFTEDGDGSSDEGDEEGVATDLEPDVMQMEVKIAGPGECRSHLDIVKSDEDDGNTEGGEPHDDGDDITEDANDDDYTPSLTVTKIPAKRSRSVTTRAKKRLSGRLKRVQSGLLTHPESVIRTHNVDAAATDDILSDVSGEEQCVTSLHEDIVHGMGSGWLPTTKEELMEYHMLSGKPRKTLETQFDEKFFQIMLDDKYNKWIRWNKAGTSVIIPDEQAFEQNVLPHFMRSTSFNSVVRQLSNYRWDRKCQISKDGVKGHIISYPGLRRDYPHLWEKVRLLPPPILQTTPALNKSRSGQFKALASHLQVAKKESIAKDQVIGDLQRRIMELERYRQQSGTACAPRDGPSRRRLKVSEVEETKHVTRGQDKRKRLLQERETGKFSIDD